MLLTEEHFELFKKFRVKAMGDKLREMVEDESYDELTFEQKMVLLVEAEDSARRSRKVAKLVKEAGFKDASACVEDVLYLPGRTLSKDRIARYAECAWVENCEVVVVIEDRLWQELSDAGARQRGVPQAHTRALHPPGGNLRRPQPRTRGRRRQLLREDGRV